MSDLYFDTVSREIVLTDGDFSLTDNPSTQNGAILQYSRASIMRFPLLGVGMEQIINSPDATAAYEMNRWQTQCKRDGAQLAKYINNNSKITAQINY